MLKVNAKNWGNVAILCLRGRMVNGETTSLRHAANSHPNVSALVLDLARVSTIDAAGLGVMLELRHQAESKGVQFKLMNVTRLVHRVLEITHLTAVFEITSEREILAAGSRGRETSAAQFAACA
jgi:anti-anti-sigma factor